MVRALTKEKRNGNYCEEIENRERTILEQGWPTSERLQAAFFTLVPQRATPNT